MKLDKGLVLTSIAAILVVGALGSSVLSLRKAEAATDELADARRGISEQARVTKRLEAELGGKLARTDARVYGLTQGFAGLKSPPGTGATEETASNLGSEAEPSAPAAPAEGAETAERAERTSEAIEHAEALVGDATQAGRWTAQDRERLQELLVQVDGPERRRIQTSVGRLLAEGTIVADGGFVPL